MYRPARPALRHVLQVLLALAVVLGTRPAGATKIDWSSFAGQLPNVTLFMNDCDVVRATIDPGAVDPSLVELVLEAGGDVSWWKGIDVPDGRGHHDEIWTHDMRRRDVTQLDAADVHNGQRLQLRKAKFLGIHTDVYELGDLGLLQPGDRVTFRWVQDRCIDVAGGLIVSRSKLPTWLMPGETARVELTYANVGGDTWRPEALMELDVRGGFGALSVPLADVVVSNQTLLLDPHQSIGTTVFAFDITAPTRAGSYRLDFQVEQPGGAATGYLRRTIVVSTTPPAPPPTVAPPPPPRQVTVPYLVGLTYEDGQKRLAAVGLTPGFVLDADPTVAAVDKIIVEQSPYPGAILLEGGRVNLAVVPANQVPFGFSALTLYNCGTRPYHVWEQDGDRWIEVDVIAPQWGDGGVCPAYGTQPFHQALKDKSLNHFVVVDPARCSQGNDPRYPACQVLDWFGVGDSNGPVYPVTLN